MIDLEYTFEVVAVHPELNSMEIVYKAEGHDAILVGAPLPRVGEPLQNVIRAYVPWGMWEARTVEYQVVEVGTSGTHRTVEPLAAEPESTDISEAEMLSLEVKAEMQKEVLKDIIREVLNES
jgi:hypothetical protein